MELGRWIKVILGPSNRWDDPCDPVKTIHYDVFTQEIVN